MKLQYLLIVMILITGEAGAKETMRIPLKLGVDNNSSFRLDDMVVEPRNVSVYQYSNIDNYVRMIGVQLLIEANSQSPESDSRHSEINIPRTVINGRPDSKTYPVAFGRYLIDLDIYGDSIALLIRELKPGDMFVLDQRSKETITIDGIAINYMGGYSADSYDIEGKYVGSELTHEVKFSKGGNEEVLLFEFNNSHWDNKIVKRWRGYVIEMIDYKGVVFKIIKDSDDKRDF